MVADLVAVHREQAVAHCHLLDKLRDHSKHGTSVLECLVAWADFHLNITTEHHE